MYIIPAIDIIGGKCVRLSKGDYNTKKVYNEDPLEVAQSFEQAGIKKLHLVDLDGAKAQKIVNWKVLEKIATKTNLEIDFGGGIKTEESIRAAYNSGANQVTCGTIAVKNPELVYEWIVEFGAEKIILGADVNQEKIAINGWQESSDLDLFPFLEKYISKGIQTIICTDIEKDGMLAGSSEDLYQKIMEQFPKLQVVASGGVTSIDEIERLQNIGCYGAIIGKAIYEGKVSLEELYKLS